jgi:peptidoglycan-associated lipoprotein
MRNNRIILLLAVMLFALAGCKDTKSNVRGGAAGGSGSAGGGTGVGGGQGGEGKISEEKVTGGKGEVRVGPDGKPLPPGKGGGGGGGGTDIGPGGTPSGIALVGEQYSPFKDIYFDFDQSTIRDDAKPVLAGIAGYLAKESGKSLIIEGHCDSRGTAEYNMALGERRAEAARKYLAALGVKSAALQTVSYGKEKPFMQGESEEAWAKNRRGHFLVK